MAFLLQPALFEKMTSLSDVQKLMKQDIKNAAGKSGVKFIAVRGVKVGSATTSLFVVTDKPKEWVDTVKKKKPAAVITGKCDIVRGPTLRIVIKTVDSGGASREAVAKLATVAVKDSKIEAVDFASIASDKLPGAQPSAKTLDMVRRSHQQAGRTFELTDDVVRQMAKLTSELAEYNKFARAFEALAVKYSFKDYKKVPVDIWAALLQSLVKSGYFKDDIPKDTDKTSFILAYKGKQGQVIREKVLAEAMEGMDKFTRHAATYLDKVVNEVLKAGGTPTWSFWSGVGAKDTARKENPGGVVLEGSVGSWFDEVWDFKPLTGVENMALWTSLSELYAQKAAEYYNRFSFRGYVGPGATREQSVFNKIEQPTFVQVLSVRQQVKAPKVDWFVVDCDNATGRWVPTGKPSAKFDSRQAALANVAQRFGS